MREEIRKIVNKNSKAETIFSTMTDGTTMVSIFESDRKIVEAILSALSAYNFRHFIDANRGLFLYFK